MNKSIRLHIGAEQTTVSVDTSGEAAEVMVLAVGQSRTAGEFFKQPARPPKLNSKPPSCGLKMKWPARGPWSRAIRG